MAILAPFKALRYDAALVKDLGRVTAPPYDILSPADQDFYYGLHSYNVVRLDFGKALSGDDGAANKYRRAATLLGLWRGQKILRRGARDAFYVIAHDFRTPLGKKLAFMGVYGLLKLQEYKSGVVRPHEKTLSKPKNDRMLLTRATRANLSPIFMLFDDPRGRAQKWLAAQSRRKPDADFHVPSGERHRLWVVDRASAARALQKLLKPLPVYIADGHHRYETMLKFSKEARGPLKRAASQTMVCLAPFQSRGMTILPTHRLIVERRGFGAGALLKGLEEDFEVRPAADLAALEKAMAAAAASKPPRCAFGLLLPGGRAYSLLLRRAPSGKSAGSRLDVALLQALVLEKRLGMTPESIAAQENLAFEKSASKAESAVGSGRAQAALLLNATRMDQLKAVSDEKGVMPQKSTYFLPKLLTGQLIRPMD